MSEIVERMARALWDACRIPVCFDAGNLRGQEKFRQLARIAIEALHEPTEAMIDAGADVGINFDEYRIGENASREVWGLMINAALEKTWMR